MAVDLEHVLFLKRVEFAGNWPGENWAAVRFAQ